MHRVSVGFFRWADFGFLARRSWFEPKMAYTHLLTQRKSPLLPSLAPLGAMWRLVGLAWAPGGLCPTPPYQLHVRPPRPLASHPLKSPYMPLVSPGRPSQLIFRSKWVASRGKAASAWAALCTQMGRVHLLFKQMGGAPRGGLEWGRERKQGRGESGFFGFRVQRHF